MSFKFSSKTGTTPSEIKRLIFPLNSAFQQTLIATAEPDWPFFEWPDNELPTPLKQI